MFERYQVDLALSSQHLTPDLTLEFAYAQAILSNAELGSSGYFSLGASYPPDEEAVNDNFSPDGAVQINELWSMTATGYYFHDSHGNGLFDERYFHADLIGGDGIDDTWLRSTDAWHEERVSKPDIYNDQPTNPPRVTTGKK